MQEVYLDNQDLLTYKAKNEEERKSGAVEAQIGCYWQKLYYWCDTLYQKLIFVQKSHIVKKLVKHLFEFSRSNSQDYVCKNINFDQNWIDIK